MTNPIAISTTPTSTLIAVSERTDARKRQRATSDGPRHRDDASRSFSSVTALACGLTTRSGRIKPATRTPMTTSTSPTSATMAESARTAPEYWLAGSAASRRNRDTASASSGPRHLAARELPTKASKSAKRADDENAAAHAGGEGVVGAESASTSCDGERDCGTDDQPEAEAGQRDERALHAVKRASSNRACRRRAARGTGPRARPCRGRARATCTPS